MTIKKNILIAEDEPMIAMLLEDYIDMLGHTILGPVQSLKEGIEAHRAHNVDAAILDVHLGQEVVWPLVERLAADNVPFAIASGDILDDAPPAFRNSLLLEKPYSFDQVEAILAYLLAAK